MLDLEYLLNTDILVQGDSLRIRIIVFMVKRKKLNYLIQIPMANMNNYTSVYYTYDDLSCLSLSVISKQYTFLTILCFFFFMIYLL